MTNNDESAPSNDEQEGDVVVSPGCDGVGSWGMCQGSWGMCRDGDGVGGYGDIPFLGDGVGSWVESPGSWVVSPGCDSVGVVG